MSDTSDTLRKDALDYHRYPTPGKISVTPTKAMATQRDLGLAYSPGVAEACLAIAEDPREAGNLTARNNLRPAWPSPRIPARRATSRRATTWWP
jgi:malic enzyme